MSIRSTRASSDCASAPARLIEVTVFPSPTPPLVTAMTCRLARLRKVSTRWRSTRYCSAAGVAGAWRLTRCSSSNADAIRGESTGTRDSITGRGARGGGGVNTGG